MAKKTDRADVLKYNNAKLESVMDDDNDCGKFDCNQEMWFQCCL